jgi:XTP/dITP diphosphohydrolase
VRSLVIGTTNLEKVIEVEAALSGLSGWQWIPLSPEVPFIEESGTTFMENAALKAIHFSQHVPGLTLSDDSGLCVAALEGRPGVYSSRYAETVAKRNDKLLNEMKDVPEEERQAKFVCALALADQGKLLWTAEREVAGRIARVPSGTQGFGYDPVFFLPELGVTMASLSTEQKNRWSARGQALGELRKFLSSL